MAVIEERPSHRKGGQKRFRALVRMKGYPTRSGTFATRRLAERWAKTIEASMIEGRHFKNGIARRRTVGDAIARFVKEVLPTDEYRSDTTKIEHRLAFWNAEIGDVLLDDVSEDLLDQKRKKLLDTPYTRSKLPGAKMYPRSPKTVNRYAANLSRVFKKCRRPWRWMQNNPFAGIEHHPEPPPARQPLTSAEFDRLFRELAADPDPQLECISSVAICTAPRVGELINLDWQDFDEDALADSAAQGVRVLLRKTKNAEPRTAWIFLRALELLRAHWKRKGHPVKGLVFTAPGRVYSKAGRRRHGGRYNYHKPFKAACARAGLSPKFTFHWLRHCAATYLAREGASTAQLKAIGGWKSNVAEIYTHLAANDTTDLVQRMNLKLIR